ncbi:MAG: hypothetical protein L0H53_15510 [Candidatus Nitrosocosmicus sp.]|nr:hypothetical protein [Candidatus Nitrosocosmicus sp.]MDN5868713.1 hypothetical protein [Candidatus Nitrosocosmicus sp.]
MRKKFDRKRVTVSILQVDYEKIGYKTGLIHVYKMNGNSKEIVDNIQT